MGVIQRKNLGQPDESREPPFAHTSLTQVGTHMIGRGVLEPGWRFTTHMAPLMGTTLCPIHHLQLLQSGRLGIRMADGEEIELVPGDISDIPPGHDAWVIGDEPAVVLDIAGNVSGMGLPVEHDRILTTLLMTDIVDSTKTLERLGDQHWKQLLREHDRLTRMLIDRYRGTEVDTTGDGFLARFASAVSALRCAMAIRDSRSGSASTRARSSRSAPRSRASASTRPRGSWRWRVRRRSSSRRRREAWPTAAACRSGMPARTR
jgi:hypothetical protein